MKIKKRVFFDILLPIVIVGFIGQQSSLVTTIISANARWFILLILVTYIFFSGKLLQGLSTGLQLTLLLYLSWCALTIFWSDSPALSSAKTMAMIMISITLTSAGSLWIKKSQWENSLSWLALLFAMTLFTGILGRGQESSINVMNGFDAYQGLANNTNYFGCLQAMIFPFLLWQTYINWSRASKRLVWGGLLAVSMIFLIQSYSRSSILMVASVSTFFIFSVDLKKKVVIGSILVLIVAMILSMFSLSMEQLIYKNHDNDLLRTRRNVWAESYDQAMKGGWFGAGFGVTIGESGFDLNQFSSVGYGREKSNSQLAIVEETGLIGLGFYGLFLIIFFKKALRFYIRLRGDEKVMMGLVLGAILGIIVQSCFEAWWDAPASPEAIFFWTLFGISTGLMRALSRNKESSLI